MSGNEIYADKYIAPKSKTVDIISCFFNVDYTLSWVSTLIIWVDKELTKIHKKIPIAIKTRGYIKLDI